MFASICLSSRPRPLRFTGRLSTWSPFQIQSLTSSSSMALLATSRPLEAPLDLVLYPLLVVLSDDYLWRLCLLLSSLFILMLHLIAVLTETSFPLSASPLLVYYTLIFRSGYDVYCAQQTQNQNIHLLDIYFGFPHCSSHVT